jgi:hypothetical protein
MRRLFLKGEPRPAKAGRRAGTPNKTTQEVGQFCREVLETPEFRQKWREYFTKTPLHRMEPKLLALTFAYAYGRPCERVELTGAESGPLEPQVIFYIPSKERTPCKPALEIGTTIFAS